MTAALSNLLNFPPEFKLGFASASYQIEGGWNADGKGENIWDRYTHGSGSKVADKSSGDIAADSYKHYKEDVALIKNMGGQVYRFSISWSRLLPTGFANEINPAGLEYYNNLINELIANKIEPLVTLYHWDLPQPFQDLGGWTNELLSDYFVDYARVCFSNFGDRVKKWITFNEPWEFCYLSYGCGIFAPGIIGNGVAEYLAGHTILKAHAKAYHNYHENFRVEQQGLIGITLSSNWGQPKTDSPEDIGAEERHYDFHVGWFAHPIFSTKGDYPETMKQIIAVNSEKEGFQRSRLPKFDDFWISYIRGSSDFYGMNHYTSHLVSACTKPRSKPSFSKDVAAVSSQDPNWLPTASAWFRVNPQGLRKALNKIKTKYNSPLIFITENGFSDNGELEDDNRISYFNSNLKAMLEAIYLDDVNVQLYTAWTLLDDFEWIAGYTEKFGITSVDFEDPERKRTPKKSAKYFTRIIQNRAIDS